MTGRVKWFDGKKGFGFITPDDGSPDAFVHHTQVQMKGYRNLEAGQAVSFEIAAGDKGPKAVGVRPICPIDPASPRSDGLMTREP